MAELITSVLVDRISNKCDDKVYYAWRGRQCVRKWSPGPGVAVSERQETINNIFKSLLPKWYGTLSESQRQGWEQFASILKSAVQAEKMTGSPLLIPRFARWETGYNAFVGLNTRLMFLGGSEQDNAPLGIPSPRGPVDLIAVVTGNPDQGYAIDLSWTNPPDAKAGDKINIWGVVMDKSKPQLIASLDYPATSYTVTNIRGKLGASIGVPCGLYHFQIAIMEPHGIQGIGSNVASIVVP